MVAEGSGGGSGRKSSSAAKSAAEGGAAKHLAGLPSRGNFSSSSISSSLGGVRVYVCEHNTSPPEGQVIRTDTTNILIRALQLNNKKSEAKDSGSKTTPESSKGKRSARSLDGKTPKRPNIASSAGSSTHGFSEQTLHSFTVEKLRALLKERGLSPKGKKDELIARLREACN